MTRLLRFRLSRLGVALWVLGLAACTAPPARPDPDIITIAVRAAPNNLDPRLANDETTARIGQLVLNGLMELDDNMRARPKLAERLEQTSPTTYLAHLRRGVKFHDGHELTSRDVVYSYRRLIDPEFTSPYKSAFRPLASVDAVDDYTVLFTVKEPFAAFPAQLVEPGIVPDGAGAEMSTAPVGTGPYRFRRYVVDDRVEFAAFEDYYEGAPANAGVVMKIVPDDTMRGLELRKGTVDITINDMAPDIIHQLAKSGEFRLKTSPGLDFFYVGFNVQDSVLRDRRVRHAIGYAIDRRAIIEYMRRGLARPATGLLTSLSWAYEPDVFQFVHDPARARQLLDEAGYRDPDGDGPLPRLRLTMKISTNEETRLQCIVIQEDLKRVGIELDLRAYEFATMFADVLTGNFQMTALQWVGGAVADPDILRRVYHSSSWPPAGFNRGRYRHPEVDRLLDLAATAATEEERLRHTSQVQKIVAEDAVYIPLWSKENAVLLHPTLSDVTVNPRGDFQALASLKRLPSP
jgi:peptide/nickel transport system substrate-binding protein